MSRFLFPATAILAIFAASLMVSACTEFSFYWQAGMGQMEILNKRRPIETVLADESVEPGTKRKLRTILRVQEFATRELALPEDHHYRYFTDLEREYVSWLVVAAQPLSLSEHQFCYLIVGCLGYRGYFEKPAAEEMAEDLRKTGLDVLVRPVRAYSTLGWFDDPVLNTFLAGDEADLIATIFHEQTHRRIFVEGDTAFNESLARFVETEGLRRYLAREGVDNSDRMRRHQDKLEDRTRFRVLVLRGREKLATLYASPISDEQKMVRKLQIFDQMRLDYQKERQSFKILNYDGWFAQPLNNAHVVGFSHYSLHMDAFQALFESEDRDFERFFAAVAALARLTPEEREVRFKALDKTPEKKLASLLSHAG